MRGPMQPEEHNKALRQGPADAGKQQSAALKRNKDHQAPTRNFAHYMAMARTLAKATLTKTRPHDTLRAVNAYDEDDKRWSAHSEWRSHAKETHVFSMPQRGAHSRAGRATRSAGYAPKAREWPERLRLGAMSRGVSTRYAGSAAVFKHTLLPSRIARTAW